MQRIGVTTFLQHLETSSEQVQISLPLADKVFDDLNIVLYFPEDHTLDLSGHLNIAVN